MKTKVFIIESELGWGSRVDETLEFETYEEALAYVKEYNNKYCPASNITPDWYMYAEIENYKGYNILK